MQTIATIHIRVDHRAVRGIVTYQSKRYNRNRQSYSSANSIQNSLDVETEVNVNWGAGSAAVKNAVRTKFHEQNCIATKSDQEESFEEKYTKTTIEGGLDLLRTETITISYNNGGCFESVTETPVNVGKYGDYPQQKLDQ